MATYFSHMIQDLKADLKRGKYRSAVKKAQKIIEQDHDFFQDYPTSLILNFMHVESYACRKIFIKEMVKLSSNESFALQKIHAQNHRKKVYGSKMGRKICHKKSINEEESDCILTVMVEILLRNFKYSYRMVNRVFDKRIMMAKFQKQQNCNNITDDFLTKSNLNQLFEMAVWVTHELGLYLQYMVSSEKNSEDLNQQSIQYIEKIRSNIKIKTLRLLGACQTFLSKISEYGYGSSTKSQRLQELEIGELYMANLLRSNLFIESKTEGNKNCVKLLSILASLTHHQKGALKSRYVTRLKKRSGKLIFLCCILLLCAHIGSGQISLSTQIYECIQHLTVLSGVRQFHGRFSIFPTLMRVCQRVASQCQDFRRIISMGFFSKTEINIYNRNSEEKFTFQPPKPQNSSLQHLQTEHNLNLSQTSKKSIKQNIIKNTQTRNKIVCSENNYHRQNLRNSPNIFKNIFCTQKEKIRTWCNNQSPKKLVRCGILKSSFASSMLKCTKFSLVKDEETIQESNRQQQEDIQINFGQSQFSKESQQEILPQSQKQISYKVSKKKQSALSDPEIYKFKEQLKLKKQLIDRNLKFKSDSRCIPHKILVFNSQIPTKTTSAVKNKKFDQNSGNKIKTSIGSTYKKPLKVDNQDHHLIYFFKLLFRNKHKLKISEYSCRLENYLSKIEFEEEFSTPAASTGKFRKTALKATTAIGFNVEKFSSMDLTLKDSKKMINFPKQKPLNKTGLVQREQRATFFENKSLNAFRISTQKLKTQNSLKNSCIDLSKRSQKHQNSRKNKISTVSIQNIDEMGCGLQDRFSECTVASILEEGKKIKQVNKAEKNEEKLDLCYRKSLQSIENVMKRVNIPERERKLLRKGHTFFQQVPSAANFRFSLI